MEELERTYLAKEIPEDIRIFPFKEMVDIYLPSISAHPGLRIRKRGDQYEITKKRPVSDGDASRQLEETIPLQEDEYSEMSALQGKRVEKTRYYYRNGGTDFEVDIFGGSLAGLVLVDVEFPSLEAKNAFQLPAFCLVEITQEEFIAGGMLCGKSYADIESDLRRFEYRKLAFV